VRRALFRKSSSRTAVPRAIFLWTVAVSVFLLAAGKAAPRPFAQSAPSGATAVFPPLEQWKAAVSSGDAAALKALYSTNPPATIVTPSANINAETDVVFWTGLKAHRLKVDVKQSGSPQPGLQQLLLQAEIHPSSRGAKVLYINAAQAWQQQSGGWRLVVSKRDDPARLQQPLEVSKEIYPEKGDARAEIKRALAEAAPSHKRVIVVFGANWCFDCHVLDLAFHRPDLAAVLDRGYKVVHVDVGRGDKNQDLMQQYQVPMKRGIPALAVLDSDGKLLFSQKSGEFENARALGPQDLLQFLNKWKPEMR
jgi:thioredoxin 1